MKATEVQFNTLLNQPKTQFIIPLYQRNYDWKYEHCKKLFDDIIAVGNSEKQDDFHFVGSVVYMEDGVFGVKDIKELVIIDGQQRITTVTLLYLALYKFAKANGLDIKAEEIWETYLTNKFADEGGKLKLRTADENHKALQLLMENDNYERDIYVDYSNVDDNFNLFKKWVNNDNFDIILKGIARLMFVEVKLERGKDDPQRIFETMNSTGLDLTQSDLIRNFILMGLDKDKQDALYRKFWEPIEKICREDNENRVSNFIRDFLTLKMQRIPNKDKVYQEYRRQYDYRNDFEKQSEHLALLKEYAEFYSYFINPDTEKDTQIFKELTYIKQLEVNVAFPFLLQVFKDYKENIIDKQCLVAVLKLLQSYVIRRLIVGLPTSALNKIFMTLYGKIKSDNYLKSIEQYLCSLRTNGLFPNDKDIANAFQTKDIYNLKSHNRKYIFELLENFEKDKDSVPVDLTSDENRLSVEHIFPQNPSSKWHDELSEDEISEIQDKYLHTIGNLTLTGYNAEYNNKYFIEKRNMEHGFKDSGLQLNKPLINIEKWDIEEIKKRCVWLSERFCAVWKYPNVPVKYNNCSEEELSLSDILDYDFSYKKIVQFNMFDKQYEKITFVDLYRIVVKEIYENNSVSSLWNKEDFMRKHRVRKDGTHEMTTRILSFEKPQTYKHLWVRLNDHLWYKTHGSANSIMEQVHHLCKVFNLKDDCIKIIVAQSTDNNIEQGITDENEQTE